MNKKLKLKLIFLMLSVAGITALFFGGRDYFINHEKTGNAGFIAENHSLPIIEENAFRAEIVTSSQAHSLQFLLVPPQNKGGQDVKLSVYTDGTDTCLLDCIVSEEDLLSGKFINIPLTNSVEKGTQCTVVIESDETDPLYATRVVFGSASGTDVAAWYSGDEIQPGTPAVTMVYHDLKTLPVLIIAVCIVMIVYAAVYLLLKENSLLYRFATVLQPLAAVGTIVVAVYIVEYLQWGDLLYLNPKAILANILIVFSAAVFTFALSGKIMTSASIAVIIALLLGLANHYLILFRGTTLLPSDFTGISTAIKVSKSYTFEIEDSVICALSMIVACFGLIIGDGKKWLSEIKIRNIAQRLVAFAASLVMIITLACKPELFASEVYLWKQMTGSRIINGFLMNFTINVPLLVREKPENYDVSVLEEFTNVTNESLNEKNSAITATRKPNILFIMNESFSDPRTVLDIKDADSLLPVLDELKNDEKAFVGQTAVSVFGGGTSCSEYEMLTGFSIRADNANTAPYLTYFHENTPSVVWWLNEMGYNTSSYHPASSRNWYRNTAYPCIGFNRTIFLDESDNTLVDSYDKLTGEKLDFKSMYSNFPSDITGYDLVIELMKESDEPVFNHHITMQNHGGYSDADVNYNVSEDDWSIYLKLLNRSDKQLGEFLDKLSDFEEPTVVVFFGDHWSYYDESKLSSAGVSIDSMTPQQITDYYSTPYVVWSNCGYDFSAMPQQTSLSYLSSLVMHNLGFELTPWQNYLVYWSEKVPVYSVYNLINNTDAETLADYEYQLKCLHYNALNDSSNRSDKIFGMVG